MKVLHLMSSTGFHGAENMAAELIRQLDKLNVENYIGVFKNNENTNLDILHKVTNCIKDGVVFNCNSKIDIKLLLHMRRYIKDNKIDIIHSHKYKTNFYSLFVRYGTGIKLVSTCHNWLGKSLNMKIYTIIDKLILRYFDYVVGVSSEVTEELKKFIPDKKIAKIGNGIDIGKYYRVMDKNDAKRSLGFENKILIGFVGRLSEDKGVSILLDAVSNITSNKRDIYTLIVGDGDYKKKLENEANSMGISDRVIFTGNRDDTPLIYSSLDVFVLPSLKEAFPMVILEAMACGVPVVATEVGDIPQIIEDEVSGMLVNTKDSEGLVRTIENILLDNNKADKIVQRSIEIVKNNNSSINMAKDYLKIYEKVLRFN